MIRFADKSDLPSVISLWSEVFGDSEELIRMFLGVHYSSDSLLVYEIDGKTVAMFFLLHGDIVIDSIEYPARYLYAACTAPEYRGRGIMGEMIAYAQKICAEKSIDYICLLPAEESLYDYYEKFGFRPIYGISVIDLKISSTDRYCNSVSNSAQADAYAIRSKAYSAINYFKWSRSAIKFAFKFNRFYGGGAHINRKGYALYTEDGDKLTVKEFACHADNDYETLSLLASEANARKISLIKPYTNYFAEKHGMILPLNMNAKSALPDDMKIYLGLTLD